jgi:hypothetical protein
LHQSLRTTANQHISNCAKIAQESFSYAGKTHSANQRLLKQESQGLETLSLYVDFFVAWAGASAAISAVVHLLLLMP